MRALRCAFAFAALFAATSFASAGSYTFSTNTTTPYTGLGEIPANFSQSQPGLILYGLSPGVRGTPTVRTPPIDILFYGQIPTTHLHGVLAEDSSINVITIAAIGATFTDVVGDIYGVFPHHDNIDFFLSTNEGEIDFSESFADVSTNPNGHNYFSLVAMDGLQFFSVTIGSLDKYNYDHSHPGSNTDTKFFAFNDLALSGLSTNTPPPPVPEPSSLLLLGSGLIAAAGTLRHKLN